jgi:transglutaminase-like putative cysteine protease
MTVEATGDSAAVLIFRPQSGVGQRVKASQISIEPNVEMREFQDPFGNILQRTILPSGQSVITSTCTVETPDAIDVNPQAEFTLVQNLPDDVLHYLLPSRYCESDKLVKLATSITKKITPGYPQAEAIRVWIYRKLRYKYGVSNASTSAIDTAKRRAGVCRDFSHLGIALCARAPNSGAHRRWISLSARSDGPACMVRSICRRTLVHVRCDSKAAAR